MIYIGGDEICSKAALEDVGRAFGIDDTYVFTAGRGCIEAELPPSTLRTAVRHLLPLLGELEALLRRLSRIGTAASD